MFNIGANARFEIEARTARVVTKVWEMACFAGFLSGREAAKAMLTRGRGTVIFTGATANLRGRENFAAFAAVKRGLRAVAQGRARAGQEKYTWRARRLRRVDQRCVCAREPVRPGPASGRAPGAQT